MPAPVYPTYLDGYSVLPALKRLDGPVFVRDEEAGWYREEKERALAQQQCCMRHELPPELEAAIVAWIVGQTNVVAPFTLEGVMLQLQEDIAIQRIDQGRDWLAGCHICFPSGWLPEEKIGRPLELIHSPIPGINLPTSHKLVETIVHHGPFVRYVWSVVYERAINYHPQYVKQPFDPNGPIYVKVERQVTWGFPEWNAAAFVLRQGLIPRRRLITPRYTVLVRT